MSYLLVTRPFTKEEKREAIEKLRYHSVPDRDFYILVIGAIILALCGIFTDSIPLLIGSMIVAPLAYPILSGGLGIAVLDATLLLRSFFMLALSLLLAVALAYIGTLVLGPIRVDPTFISFIAYPVFDVLVAFVAGIIAAYGLVRPKAGGALTGIGVAVSLMPPLVAVGIGLADGIDPVTLQALFIFLLNVVGILVGSILVFLCCGLREHYRP
jgi:uncharacterized hydrophobic protein (TIGR00271 family)